MKCSNRFEVIRAMGAGFAVLACCLVWGTPAQAQFGMMRGGGPQLASRLLAMKEVQKELGLSEKQIEEIAGPAAEINETLQSEVRSIITGGGDQEEIAELVKELKEEEKGLVDLLDDQQMSRLKQLQYQRLGVALFQDADVQAAIEMSDDQIREIDDALKASQEKMNQAFQDARQSGDREAIRDVMRSTQEELEKTVNDVLTDAQREKVAEMKGKPFEFPQPQRGNQRRSDF